MALRHGSDHRLTTPFVAAYMSVSILAQAMQDAATDAPDAIRRVVTSRLFDTPLGPIAINPRTHHAALRPHLAISNAEREFEIFHSAANPVEADPYLVHSLAQPLASTGSATDTILKVIK